MLSSAKGAYYMKLHKSIKLAEEVYLANQGNLKKSERELKKLIKKGQDTGDTVLISAAFFYIGFNYYDICDNEGIIENARKAIALLKDTKEYPLLMRAYILLGYSYEQQVDYKAQLEVYETAYKMVKKHRLGIRSYITVLNNLASCYHHMGENKSAIKMEEECLRLNREHAPKDSDRIVMYSINLAEDYQMEGEYEKERDILESAKEHIGKVEFKPYACDYYLKLALAYFDLNDAETAFQYTDEAFSYIEDEIYPYELYDDLRLVLHQLLKNGEKERSRRIFELMRVYNEKKKGIEDQILVYRAMAEFYATEGESETAIEYYAKLDELNMKRRDELNKLQFSIHKRESDAENEIRKLKTRLSKTEELAFLDPLSKLLNRSALLRISNDFLDTAYKKKEKVGAIFIDIDFFKQCNDTYGHAKGDEIICEIAKACKAEETQNIRFARYGGDEFFGITKNLDDEEVIAIAQRISERIRKADIPNELNPNGHRVTLSMGAVNVLVTHHTDTIIEIANYADKAVYHAKNTGKNRICFLEHKKKKDPYITYESDS